MLTKEFLLEFDALRNSRRPKATACVTLDFKSHLSTEMTLKIK